MPLQIIRFFAGLKYALLVLAIASIAWAVPASQNRQDTTAAPKPPKDDAPEVPAVVKEASQPPANVTVGKAPEAPKNQSSVASAPVAAKDAKDQKSQPQVDLSVASAESASEVKSGKAIELESAQVEDLVGSPFSVEFDGMQGDQPASIESGELVPSSAAGAVRVVDAKEQPALPVVVVEDKPAAADAKPDSARDAWGSMIDGIIGQLQDLKRKTRALEDLAHRK